MAYMRLAVLFLLCTLFQGCIDDRRSAADDDTVDQSVGADANQDAAIPPPPPRPDAGQDAAPAPGPCETAEDCPRGADCVNGQCTEPECTSDDQCTALVQSCIEGACRDRCLGDRCVRGGICIDGYCLPPECEADADCENDTRCREGLCEEWTACTADPDCGEDERCQDGACEPLPECVGDRGCDRGTICEDGLCRPQPPCDADTPCGDDLDCVGGRCVPFVCRADRDCEGAAVCRAGECQEPSVPEVAAIIILTPPQTLPPGAPLELRAVGLSLRGDIVVSEGFTWETDSVDVLVIDNDDELASISINALDGASGSLTATFQNEDGAEIQSQPVAFRVTAPADAAGLTVSVVDASTGRPIGGATVLAGADSRRTDETGRITFEGVDEAVDLTVFSADYDYLSIVGVDVPDEGAHLLLPLRPRTVNDRVAGFTGVVDYDRVRTQGGVELGLTGPSFASGLTQVTFDNLLGQTFNRAINAGPVNIDLPLPGGLTLAADIPFVGQIDAKTTYFVSAEPGLRLGWSFGGRIDIESVIALAMGGDGDGIGRVLGVLLPYFETFDHGLRVGERLVALPRVVDEDDVDGDGDATERVPDYERFPVLNIGPDQQQRLRLEIDAATAMSDGETAIFFPGVQFEGIGFVPLGVTAATEPGLIPARMAAPYGGLEGGTPTVLAISTVFGDATDLPQDLTLHIQRYGIGVPRQVTFSGEPLERPDAAEYNAVLRQFGGAGSAGAHLHRASFNGPDGRWEVYFGPEVATEFTLPVPPEGLGDLGAATDVRFEAIALDTEGQNAGLTFGDLIRLAGNGDLSQIDEKASTVARKSL